MLHFTVESSSGGHDYEVTAYREDGRVRMSCQCEAANNGLHCKHRVNLLLGTAKEQRLTSGNPADVLVLREWLVGTPLEGALSTVVEAEKQLETLKRRVANAKKILGIALATGHVPG
ncbi:MAG: hypothetical protein ACOY6K_17010 [Pseudomonadota bacterium]